ncbi:MAG TPA: methylated-DNA--[protein]-cysteine S-methyltransferase [Polyangiaceae bacterium]
MPQKLSCSAIPSPIGRLTLLGDGAGLHGIYFEGARAEALSATCARDARPLRQAIRQLEEYFAGRRTAFDLSLSPRGTAFQRRVWHALSEIPFGGTWSYAAVAQRIGAPGAARAVGAANGKNPLPIVVPCHRVIGADGSLTGFGGGMDRKRWLLDFEASSAARAEFGKSRSGALSHAS